MTPEWKASRDAALAQWRERMTPEQAAEYAAFAQAARDAKAASRQARKARDAARAQRDRDIVALLMAGESTRSIAERLGLKPRLVRKRCEFLGFERAAPLMRRVPSGWISVVTRDEIAALANELGCRPRDVVERVLTYAFEEGALHARRLLRAPKRRAEP